VGNSVLTHRRSHGGFPLTDILVSGQRNDDLALMRDHDWLPWSKAVKRVTNLRASVFSLQSSEYPYLYRTNTVPRRRSETDFVVTEPTTGDLVLSLELVNVWGCGPSTGSRKARNLTCFVLTA